MRNQILRIGILSLLWLAPGCAAAKDAGQSDEQEKQNIRQVFETYIASVNEADLTLAARVWAQTPDVSAITPLGRSRGWESIKADVYVNLLQKMFAERRLQPENLVIHVSGDVAWANYDWKFAAKLADGQPMASSGWESHVYRKVDGKWVIVHLHYSSPVTRQ